MSKYTISKAARHSKTDKEIYQNHIKYFGIKNGRMLYVLHESVKKHQGSFSERLDFAQEILELNKRC